MHTNINFKALSEFDETFTEDDQFHEQFDYDVEESCLERLRNQTDKVSLLLINRLNN